MIKRKPINNNFNKLSYQNHVQDYIATKQVRDVGGGSMDDRLKLLSEYLRPGTKIFEIGSGGGEDALALQHAGYRVLASDFVEGFVEKCGEKGLKVINFDAKKDVVPDAIEAIYANAVFVHFSPEEVSDFLVRAREKLVGPKFIFLSVLKGEGYERSGRSRGFERDFQYYSQEQINKIVSEAGFTILVSQIVEDKWIQVIAKV